MKKALPGAVVPSNVILELEKVEKELLEERAKRKQATAEAIKFREALEDWEAKAKGALVKEQEILDGLGWVKNA